jgi:hypothetical protein
MTVVIQDDQFFFADEKVPVASDAVVEPNLARKQRANGERPDREFVSQASVMLFRVGEVVSPKLHEKALRHYSSQTENARYQRRIENRLAKPVKRDASK